MKNMSWIRLREAKAGSATSHHDQDDRADAAICDARVRV
jgi:hypothetical protein